MQDLPAALSIVGRRRAGVTNPLKERVKRHLQCCAGPRGRDAVELVLLLGFTCREAAKAMRLTRDSVRSYVDRFLRRMRKHA